MKALRIALFATAALAVAGAAQAQDFQPKQKGTIMLNVRLTDVSSKADDAITTAAGAATGLNVDVKRDTVPTIGISYFLTDHVAIEAIAGTSKHTVKVSAVSAHETD